MPTTNMSLTLPTVSVTVGPTFASQINAAITTIDAHDHTTGRGVRIPTAGVTIDANLSFAGYSATALKSTTFTQQSALATANSVWTKTDGNLYFTNGSGVSVQITSSGTLNTSALITSVYSQLALAANLVIGATDTYTHYLVSTAAARVITLPAANLVDAGRYYIFTDSTGAASSNNITISRAGTDTIEGGTSWVIDRAYGSARLISDGISKWSVVTERDATTTEKGRIRLSGDLAGTADAPTVVGLTGTAGVVSFGASVSSPTIKQTVSASTTGQNMTISAQDAAGTNNDGGNLTLISGYSTGTGASGRVQMALGSGSVMVVAGQFATTTRKYVALCGQPLGTDIPTGDGVVWIANAATTPTSSPVGGGVLYVEAGALCYKGSGGKVTTIAAAS